MRFNQATKAPIVIEIGTQKLSVPKFTLRDCVAWCAKIDAERADIATARMDAIKRFHLLNNWDMLPTDITELSKRVKTPAGLDHICSTCLSRAVIIEEDGKPPAKESKPIGEAKAREIIDSNPEGLSWLTEQLADVIDRSKPKESPDDTGETGDKKAAQEDPLAVSANNASIE